MKAPISTIKLAPKRRRVEPWAEIQKAVFKRVKVRTPSGTKTKTRLDAYLQHLTEAAALGDIHASSEVKRLIKYLDLKQILEKPKEVLPGSIMMKERMDAHDRMIDFFVKVRSIFFGYAFLDMKKRYDEAYGFREITLEMIPKFVDLPAIEPILRRVRRASIKAAPKSNGVGYAHPPTASQWSSGQSGNPSGKRRPKDDAWEGFRAGLSRNIAVLKDGKTSKMASAELIATRLFENAIKGSRTARVQLRQMIVELNERKLLEAPAVKPRRRRRVPLDDHARKPFDECKYAAIYGVKHDMIELMDEMYGPLAEVETELERELRLQFSSERLLELREMSYPQ